MKEMSETELSTIAYNYSDYEVVDTIEGDCGRWTQHITTIFKDGNKFYALEWERGLTEYQEDEFYWQPYEVEPYQETIVVTKYKTKEAKSNG